MQRGLCSSLRCAPGPWRQWPPTAHSTHSLHRSRLTPAAAVPLAVTRRPATERRQQKKKAVKKKGKQKDRKSDKDRAKQPPRHPGQKGKNEGKQKSKNGNKQKGKNEGRQKVKKEDKQNNIDSDEEEERAERPAANPWQFPASPDKRSALHAEVADFAWRATPSCDAVALAALSARTVADAWALYNVRTRGLGSLEAVSPDLAAGEGIKVTAFGSQAAGLALPGSDVDLKFTVARPSPGAAASRRNAQCC